MSSRFMSELTALRAKKDYRGIIQNIPYAQFLGIEFCEQEDGKLLFLLPFKHENVGHESLPALHGGVIGGFLENSAFVELLWRRDSVEPPRIIDFALDYLQSARAETLFAQCSITRQGKRVAHILVEAWQKDRAKPVAVGRVHFLLSPSVSANGA